MARQAHKSSHLERRHRTWYAVLVIPEDARHRLGKSKFFKSTQTSDRYRAEMIAAGYVSTWKKLIEDARFQTDDTLIDEALELSHELKKANGDPFLRELVWEIIDEQTEEMAQKSTISQARAFKEIATGKLTITLSMHSQWLAYQQKKGLATKTIDQISSDLDLFYKTFPTIQSITTVNAEAWIEHEKSTRKLTPASFTRVVGSFRNFLAFLKAHNHIPRSTPDPFHIPDEYKTTKGNRNKTLNKVQSWIPFTPEELIRIHDESKKLKSPTLSNLIVIAAYSGARIEELCSLKPEHIDLKAKTFSIVESKTEASTRLVPIHSKVLPLITKMIDESTDGYLVSGMTPNKYGARSDALGKTFGRLKTKMGFGPQHVFHSIRKTTVTALENNGIPENVCADIVGHKKPNMTFGLYSGGTTIEVKRKAIQKITFGFSA
jgi:integrase